MGFLSLVVAIITSLSSCRDKADNDTLRKDVQDLKQHVIVEEEKSAEAQAAAAAMETRTLTRFLDVYSDAIKNAGAKLSNLKRVEADRKRLGNDYQGTYNNAFEEFRNSLIALVEVVEKGRNDLRGLSENINELTDHNVDEIRSCIQPQDEQTLTEHFETIRDGYKETVNSLNAHLERLAQTK
jgi:hypothetical protein